MEESKIRDDNFYQICGWMLNRLGLKGTALQVYAIIYGYSQDGESCYKGGLRYLCDFTGASKNTVIKALKDLIQMGYVVKTETRINGVAFHTYRAVPAGAEEAAPEGDRGAAPGGDTEIAPGVQKLNRGCKNCAGVVQKLHRGGAETAPNNKYIINNNKYKEKKEKKEKKADPAGSAPPTPYEQIQRMYNETCRSLSRCTAMSEARRKAIKARMTSGYTLADFQTLFIRAEASDFLRGRNPRNWTATFDWLIKDANMAKVLDGNYDNKGGNEHGVSGSPSGAAFGNIV